MTRIYLAARYSRHPEMQHYAKNLEARGHTVTSRWIWGSHALEEQDALTLAHWMPIWALEDMADLAAAEVCVSFTEVPGDIPGRARGGRHAEFGMAMALGKWCIIVGPREHVFHWAHGIDICATWDEALVLIDAHDTTIHKD